MVLNKILPALMILSTFGILASARAELVSDSPAFITGSIASASATTVTLKLEDGRTERKIPRKFFPASTDFYPGRIVSLKVTEELRAVLSPDAKPRDLTDSELVNLIHSMQKGIGQKRTDKGESAEFEPPSTILDFLSIRSAYSATDVCAPFSEFGMILKFRESAGKCVYERPSACPGRKSDSAFQQCNPLIYGNGVSGSGLCKSEDSKNDSCGQQFANSCRSVKLAGKQNEKACIEKLVLPYVKEHQEEFRAFSAAFAASDLSVNGNDTSCILAAGDPLNADVSERANTAKYTKFSVATCGGQSLCVREVKCKDSEKDTIVTSRFVRCRADLCGSANACLQDRPMSGNSAQSGAAAVSRAAGAK